MRLGLYSGWYVQDSPGHTRTTYLGDDANTRIASIDSMPYDPQDGRLCSNNHVPYAILWNLDIDCSNSPTLGYAGRRILRWAGASGQFDELYLLPFGCSEAQRCLHRACSVKQVVRTCQH